MSVDQLQTKIRKLKNPSMIGLDPTMSMLPPQLLQQAYDAHGRTLAGIAAAYENFCSGILQAVDGIVPAVKLQSYCFDVLGSDGVAVLQRLMQQATQMGFYVLLDSNYGSVGHISQLYATSVFEGLQMDDDSVLHPYHCDGVSVNGYLGSDGIQAFLPYCRKQQKNLFLYVKTSNKSSREVQDLISGDRVVYSAMADLAMRWSNDLFGKFGYSEIIAVVGAPYPHVLETLRKQYDRLFFMVPGYGAQGGTAKQVQEAFDRMGHGAIISASRSVIAAWQKAEDDGSNYIRCAREAAEKMRDDITKYVTVV